MFTLVILFLTLFFICIIMYLFNNKDPFSPAVIHPMVWSISLIGSLFINSTYVFLTNSWILFYFILGIISFLTGYLFIFSRKHSNNAVSNFDLDWLIKGKITWLIIFVLYILTFLYIIKYISLVRTISSSNDIFLMMRYYRYLALTGDNDMGLLKYIVPLINSFANALIIMFIASNRKLVSKGQIITSIFLVLILAILGTGRGILLTSFLPLLISFAIMKKIDRGKVIKHVFTGTVIFFIVFIAYEYLYQSPDFTDRSSFQLYKGFEKIPLYLSGGVLAFATKFTTPFELEMGANTFRFFLAVLGDVPRLTVDTAIAISENNKTNVYTVYEPYVKDFGFIFGLTIMLCLGIIYGFIYKKMLSLKPIWVFFYSCSVVPLLLQSFDDRYFTNLSTWVQTFFWGTIFLVITIRLKKNRKG